jgi:hypothetical protein
MDTMLANTSTVAAESDFALAQREQQRPSQAGRSDERVVASALDGRIAIKKG